MIPINLIPFTIVVLSIILDYLPIMFKTSLPIAKLSTFPHFYDDKCGKKKAWLGWAFLNIGAISRLLLTIGSSRLLLGFQYFSQTKHLHSRTLINDKFRFPLNQWLIEDRRYRCQGKELNEQKNVNRCLPPGGNAGCCS